MSSIEYKMGYVTVEALRRIAVVCEEAMDEVTCADDLELKKLMTRLGAIEDIIEETKKDYEKLINHM